MRVAIRVDATPLIGGGHAMRCLTLADALTAKGADITFVSAAMPKALEERITAAGYRLSRIQRSPELEREGANWHEPPLSEQAQSDDLRATRETIGSAGWLVIDHYLLDARWHSAAREFAGHILVIDDLANRTYDCDLLVDQTFGRSATDYRNLVPPHSRVLAGSLYALLRPEFARERRTALERRQATGPVRRILVSMGTTDPGGTSTRIVEDLLPLVTDSAIDVVLGPLAPSLGRLQELARNQANVTLHVNSRNMAELMRDADVAIGAAGATSWERCCLGLPSIALVLAENQRSGATALEAAGAAVAVESAETIGAAVQELICDPQRLAQMSGAAFAITDGRGTQRVVAAALGETKNLAGDLRLRPAVRHDLETLWMWRNDPVTRAQSRNTAPISWEAHVRWVTNALADRSRKILIGETNGTPAGNVGFHQVNGDTEVSIVVAPEYRGMGIGRALLSAACSANAAPDVYAAVRIDNMVSRRLFECCGFHQVESTEPGFVRYLRPGEERRRKQA